MKHKHTSPNPQQQVMCLTTDVRKRCYSATAHCRLHDRKLNGSSLRIMHRQQLPQIKCRGSKKSEGIPEHESLEREHKSRKELGDKESPKVCTRLKSCESLYTCSCSLL
jgi:hypothetical protein